MALRLSEKMNLARVFYSVDLCYCVRVPSSLSTRTSGRTRARDAFYLTL